MGSFAVRSEPSQGWLATWFCCSSRDEEINHQDMKQETSLRKASSHSGSSLCLGRKVLWKQLLMLVLQLILVPARP
jgi:hypothetical protein